MKIKSLPIGQVKAGPEDGLKEGEFIVYPSTFTREPDTYGDVVAKGAFLEGIKEWADSGDVMPGMYLHDPNQIVAGASDMGEDDHGWWVKGAFDEDDPHAQKVYRWLKGRRLSSLSFAYDTLEEGEVELDGDRKANELRKLMPLEFSFLPKGFAANSDTSVVAVKALADAVTADMKAGRVLSSRNETTLREAVTSLDAASKSITDVLAAVSDEESNDEKAKASEPVKDEGLTVKSEEPMRPSPSDLSALLSIQLADVS